MSLLKQIDDKGAVLEWSPVSTYPNLVALGTKDSSSVGFDDYGGELEIHRLDLNERNPATKLLGKTRANSRFSSIAWSQMALNRENYSYGLIAGGMNDGYIHIWDPSKIVQSSSTDPLIASVEQHSGAIRGLQFNPHRDSSHLLASGGNDGEVFVMSLENPTQPNVFVPAPPPNSAKHTAEVTKVAWNSQVAYILASAAQNGSSYVWDLRQKKAWCELRDPAGGAISDIAWNPDQGLNIITASGDDKNPVIKLWDLRASTTLPLATLQGHTEGILSVSWCPTDPSLVLSCGKDNQTILWDLFLLQPVYHLTSSHPSSFTNHANVGKDANDQNVFTGIASSAGQRRYHVSWAPCLPAVIGACSFDRSLQFYSLSGVKSKQGRAPKWLRRPVGACFGFGGKLASFDNGAATAIGSTNTAGGKIKLTQVIEDPVLVANADNFHNAIVSGDFKSFCELKCLLAKSPHDREIWSLMKVIWFENSAREELLRFLGFSSESIESSVQKYVTSRAAGIPSPPRSPIRRPLDLHKNSTNSLFSMHEMTQTAKVSAEELFSTSVDNYGPVTSHLNQSFLSAGGLDAILETNGPTLDDETTEERNNKEKTVAIDAEPVIAKAIVAGNFAGAVDCCLSAGLLAEALLLAQCGDQSLWLSTQEAFFNLQKGKRPFLTILHSIIKQDLRHYILSSDLKLWRETMAILSTYAKTEEFPILCETLASRLENELKDIQSATLCYMCATNVSRVLGFWVNELNEANMKLGMLNTNSLQEFIEKVIVFTQANPTQDLGKETNQYFIEYASILAGQGRLDIATYFLKGSNQSETVLADRLYNAGSKPLGTRPPPFPFTRVNIAFGGTAAAQTNPQAVTNGTGSQTQARNVVKTNAATNQSTQSNVRPGPGPTNIAPVAASQLPPGWLELVDPASGRPYYVNQATGKSQWERPPVEVAPQPIPQPSRSVPTQQPLQSIPTSNPAVAMHANQPGPSPYQKQVSPHAAGPSTSQGFPQAVPQSIPQAVTNVPSAIPQAVSGMPSTVQHMTQIPQSVPSAVSGPSGSHSGAPLPHGGFTQSTTTPPTAVPGLQNPGIASPIPNKTAPVGGSSPAPATPTPVAVSKPVGPPIQSEAIQVLGAIIEQVAGSNLTPRERKQITAVNQSYSHLLEKASQGDITPDVVQKIEQLVHELSVRNYVLANAIQTELANTVWTNHKEWLKGVKILIQLASKR